MLNYNIPKKLGNYNNCANLLYNYTIITYQKKLGNYNNIAVLEVMWLIITYQKKLGNYNAETADKKSAQL